MAFGRTRFNGGPATGEVTTTPKFQGSQDTVSVAGSFVF
jgi:hypothetical protein